MSEAEIRKPVRDMRETVVQFCSHSWVLARVRSVQQCTKCGVLRMRPGREADV